MVSIKNIEAFQCMGCKTIYADEEKAKTCAKSHNEGFWIEPRYKQLQPYPYEIVVHFTDLKSKTYKLDYQR